MILADNLISKIRTVPDFPQPGISYKDITPLLSDPDSLGEVIDRLYEQFKDLGITKVCGIESRGFIFGATLAARLGAGLVLIRKPGKLPCETYSIEYDLEYGSDKLEIHQDALSQDDVVLLHDDILATGGTLSAAYGLLENINPNQIHISVLLELGYLKGKDNFPEACKNNFHSLISID